MVGGIQVDSGAWAENYLGVFRGSEHKMGYMFQHFREVFVEASLRAGS